MISRFLLAVLSTAVFVGGVVYVVSLGVVPTHATDNSKIIESVRPPADKGGEQAPAPEPVSQCSQCEQSFCSVSGVRCTLTDCENGAHGCCNYSCVCDPSCTTVSIPSNACTYSKPCCAGPGQLRFCKYVDVECVATGCEGSCWSYECHAAPCSDNFNCPPNACPGTCS